MSRIYNKESCGINFHVEEFNSASEVAQVSKSRKITDERFEDESTRKSRPHFTGVKNYEEALQLLRIGYQPIVDSMRGVFKAKTSGESRRYSFRNEIAGFAPVVPLAMKGVPECMINMRMVPIKAKVISIYYDCTESANTDKEDLLKSGKILLSAIMELEKQGYRLNLYCVQSYASAVDCDMLVVKVKSDAQPIDLKRISFPLAHPAFFRVIGFDWYSKVPEGKYRFGYGQALQYHLSREELEKVYKKLFGENAIVLNGGMIRRRNKDYVKEVIENAGKNSKKR